MFARSRSSCTVWRSAPRYMAGRSTSDDPSNIRAVADRGRWPESGSHFASEDRRRETGSAAPHVVAPDICRDARHQRTSVREPHDLIDRGVNGVEELDFLLRTERAASPTTEFSLGALSDVFPEDAGRFASHDAAGSP